MKKYILSFTLILSATAAFAQPGSGLGNIEIGVTEKYKAKVGEAVKMQSFPDFEDTTAKKLQVNYRITSQPVPIKFNPEPLSPARIARIPVDELPKGMVKLGFGLYTTPLAEAYYNTGRSSKYNLGFYGRHFSTITGVENTLYDNNGISENRLGGYFNRFYKELTWKNKVEANFNKYSYYGIDPVGDLTADSTLGDSEYNWQRSFGFNTEILEAKPKDLGLVKKLGLGYYHFNDRFNSKENYVDLKSGFVLPAADEEIDLAVNLSYFKTVYDTLLTSIPTTPQEQSYFSLQLRPTVKVAVKDLLFNFGINLQNLSFNGVQNDSNELSQNSLYFFPILELSYPVVEDVLSLKGGITGYVEQNTYRSLANKWHFMNPALQLIPSRTTELYIAMDGILSSTTSFVVKGGYRDLRGMALPYRDPFYYTDSASSPGIDVVYDDAKSFFIRGELSTRIREDFTLSVSGELRDYNMENVDFAWHTPNFTAGLLAQYIYREKIKVGADMKFTGSREAFVQDNNQVVSSTLPAYFLTNLQLEYLYNTRLSAFINVYNLTNSKYDVFLGYQAQKINFMLGLGYKF